MSDQETVQTRLDASFHVAGMPCEPAKPIDYNKEFKERFESLEHRGRIRPGELARCLHCRIEDLHKPLLRALCYYATNGLSVEQGFWGAAYHGSHWRVISEWTLTRYACSLVCFFFDEERTPWTETGRFYFDMWLRQVSEQSESLTPDMRLYLEQRKDPKYYTGWVVVGSQEDQPTAE